MQMLTHEEYIAWQTIYTMSDAEKEEVDAICTALMNLGMCGETARSQALRCFRDVVCERVAKLEKEFPV